MVSSLLLNDIILLMHRVSDLYALKQKGKVFSLLPSAPLTPPPNSQHLAGDMNKPSCSKWTIVVFHTGTSMHMNLNSVTTPDMVKHILPAALPVPSLVY